MATPDWKGLFEWSMKHQDGTTDAKPSAMKPEDRAWFEEALQAYTVDVAQRMGQIKRTLDEESDANGTVQAKAQLLDELMDIVENIDYARDLTKIGGFETLMDLLGSRHPELRARAAEVTATCVQNNPPVQAWFQGQGALPHLMKLLNDAEAVCRQKALLAVSCLIRNFRPGLEAFVSDGGIGKVISMLAHDTPAVQRKALRLLAYITTEEPDQLRALPLLSVASTLASSDRDLREAGLTLLTRLAESPATRPGFEENPELLKRLELRKRELAAAGEEERAECEDEAALLKTLLQELAAPPQSRASQPSGGYSPAADPKASQPLLLAPAR